MSLFTGFDATASVEYSHRASRELGKDYWLVNREFKFYFFSQGDRYWVNVPKGYLTDGASVPRAMWSIIPPWGNYGQAAIVHDYLCEFLSVTDDNGRPVRINRQQADQIFNLAMQVLEVPERRMIIGAVSAYRMLHNIKGVTLDPAKRAIESEIAQHGLS